MAGDGPRRHRTGRGRRAPHGWWAGHSSGQLSPKGLLRYRSPIAQVLIPVPGGTHRALAAGGAGGDEQARRLGRRAVVYHDQRANTAGNRGVLQDQRVLWAQARKRHLF